ncbi:MAG TPA: nicotinate phosphoribosyltransferase [Candidatus Binataceae bacterium]|nr:nicotinate phosphoribosyltransferase [Candidatus Binataceae bacterium]
MKIDLRLDPAEMPLLIDLYELTMAASYFQLGFNQPATFAVSVRRMPLRRGFLVAAGLERLLEAVEAFHFDQSALDYLSSLKLFAPEFLTWLGTMRFTGEICAITEGTVFFADEPILEITAPLIEAQLLETLVLNQLGPASLLATKAARVMLAARGRSLIDFGLRRAHGADAGLLAARSSYLAGFIGTSNVLAGRRYGIPLYGTMAHSYVMAHDGERAAFEHYTQLFPDLSALLVDTYDTLAGVENAARVALELKRKGHKLQAIRLDSGDLAALSLAARRVLDREGLREVAIFATGNLDEYRIDQLLRAGAPIDAFGVGAETAVSGDAPSLDMVYKLAEYAGAPRMKISIGKTSAPGRRQIFRALNPKGGFYSDLIALAQEGAVSVAHEFKPAPSETIPLLQRVMTGGHRIGAPPVLVESRAHLLESLAHLEQCYKDLEKPDSYPVRQTAALDALVISERMRSARRQER